MTTPNPDPDRAAIHQAALDYYGGWYEANVARIARSLHPELAKRAIKRDEKGRDYLYQLNRERMLDATRRGGGSEVPPAERRCDVTLLDRYEEVASVKVVATEYIDYLHLAKQNGEWLIVNALWTDNRAWKGGSAAS